MAFFQICLMVKDNELTEKYDGEAHAAYAFGADQFVSYDNKETIIAKVSLQSI